MESDSHEAHIVGQLTEIQMPLRLYVQSLLPGDSSASDVVQQTNTTIWKKRADYTPGTNFKAWSFAIARFEVLNYRKQRARDSRFVFSGELEQIFAADLSEKNDDSEKRHLALQQCLGRLRSADRDLLMHRYSSTAGTLEVYAKQTGRSPGGLKVTLHRLRNTLLNCMQHQLKTYELES